MQKRDQQESENENIWIIQMFSSADLYAQMRYSLDSQILQF